MTIREYISGRFSEMGLTVSEADFADIMAGGLDIEGTYDGSVTREVGVALIPFIAEYVMKPKTKAVSEGGVSVSWEYGDLVKWYMWLCKRYGITPDDDLLALSGISTLTDISDRW